MKSILTAFAIVFSALSGTPVATVEAEVGEFLCPDKREELGDDMRCRRKVTILEVGDDFESAPDDAGGLSGDRGFEKEDWFLLVPRAVLFVPRLALLGLYIPLRAGLTLLDRHHVIEHTVDLLYNDARTAAILPYASFRSDFGLGVGANAFHRDLFGHGERLSASARFGGRWVQGYQIGFEADRLAGSRVWLDALGRWESNPSLLFAGIGLEDDAGVLAPAGDAYYAQRRWLGVLSSGVTLGERGALFQPGARLVYNHREFSGEPERSSRTSVEEVYDVSAIPGFAREVDTLEGDALVRVDLRKQRGLRRRGFFTESFVGLVGLQPERYLHWGTQLSWAFELWAHARILTLRTVFEGVASRRGEVPFSELPRLGGNDRLRGHDADRYRDRNAGVATIAYSYPIHRNVSGHFFLDSGSVAADPAELLQPSRLLFGYGGGLHVGSPDSIAFRLEVAGGDGVHFYLSTDLARALEDRWEQL